MNKWIFIGLSLLTSLLFAQEKDSLKSVDIPVLKEIILFEDKLQRWAVGSSVLTLDSVLEKNSYSDIASLLSGSSHIRIRSYGAGGLASSSIRGAGASHTQILWNGIVLNQLTTGQQDLSLIPVFFIDELDVQSGGLSSLLGEGAVGGSIHLQSTSLYDQGVKAHVQVTVGSFGQQMYGLKTQISNSKRAFDVRLFSNAAENNYTFKDPYLQGEKREVEHASFLSRGIQTSYAYRLNKYWNTNIRYWHQETDRELAPSISEAFSVAEQQDESDILLFQIHHQKENLVWNSQIAYQHANLIYEDSLRDVFSEHRSYRYKLSQDLQWRFSDHQVLRLENSIQLDTVKSTNLDVLGNNEIRFASGINYRNWVSDKLLFVLGARQEVINNDLSPFLPSIAFKVKPDENWNLEWSWSRSYKRPTWNDKYWRPGGNPDLQDEIGWMTNLRMGMDFSNGNVKKNIGVSWYFGRINDWIIWLPSTVGTYWTPENIALVEQKGVELETVLEFENSLGIFRYDNTFSCQLANDLNAKKSGDRGFKQLVY
nr:TonB-dependent receptor [Flavobacteriales bacterium]